MPTRSKTSPRPPRTRRAAAPASRQHTPAASPGLADPLGWGSSLAPMQGLLLWMAQWRQSQAAWLQDMDQAWRAALLPSAGANELPSALQLQHTLASENLGRVVHAASALWRSWLETEAALLEQASAPAADLARKQPSDAIASRPAPGAR